MKHAHTCQREKDKNVHCPLSTISPYALREIADAIRQERKNKAEKERPAAILCRQREILYKYVLISV